MCLFVFPGRAGLSTRTLTEKIQLLEGPRNHTVVNSVYPTSNGLSCGQQSHGGQTLAQYSPNPHEYAVTIDGIGSSNETHQPRQRSRSDVVMPDEEPLPTRFRNQGL